MPKNRGRVLECCVFLPVYFCSFPSSTFRCARVSCASLPRAASVRPPFLGLVLGPRHCCCCCWIKWHLQLRPYTGIDSAVEGFAPKYCWQPRSPPPWLQPDLQPPLVEFINLVKFKLTKLKMRNLRIEQSSLSGSRRPSAAWSAVAFAAADDAFGPVRLTRRPPLRLRSTNCNNYSLFLFAIWINQKWNNTYRREKHTTV